MNDRQEKATVRESTAHQKFIVGKSVSDPAVSENLGRVKTWERCFKKRIVKELGKIVDIVEDRIQNALLTAIDSIVTSKFELALRSINASSGQDATSVIASSERGEHIGITALF